MKKELLAALALAAILCGCGANKADAYYESGRKAVEAGNYEEAISALDKAIAGESHMAEAYRLEGLAWYALESYPEAIAAFQRSLNNMDTSNITFQKDVLYYLAQARLAYGETDKTIDVYSEILKLKEEPQAFFLRGKVYLQKDDLESAAKDFERALKDCKDYNLYINIYELYVDRNLADTGEAYLDMALEMKSETGQDYYQRGRIYEHKKDYENACDTLIQALNMGDEEAMLLLGRVYLQMGDSASARSMYQEYLSEQEPSAQVYNGLVLCDIYEGNYDQALSDIQSGLEIAESEDDKRGLLYNEIVAYEYKREFDTAKTKMNAYLEQYPDDEEALRENAFLSTR